MNESNIQPRRTRLSETAEGKSEAICESEDGKVHARMTDLMDDDEQPLANNMDFRCRSCGKTFKVARDEWKGKNGKLTCPRPECDRWHNYGISDDISPPPL
jgi:hypothetical protein